ncbi:hypothetical protein HYS00_01835 [Candidatus Microgenomates bacterium]|nr:hypothetical protein [Candidatus Microgenomates bacterium]
MLNTTHNIESFENRLARFQNNSPIESIETLLNSIDNYFNNEIGAAPERYQTSLLFMGIHAVTLTISEVFWGLSGESGYKKFIETFVDGKTDDTRFSTVSNKIHNWRNVLAHQWLASSGYEIQYDYKMESGFVKDEDLLIVNPKIYCEYYLAAFSAGGKIWNYEKILTGAELESAKQRIISKFVRH